MFIKCADVARADYLIIGNQRHFPKFWKETKIFTSCEFIGLVAPHWSRENSMRHFDHVAKDR
jgi:hypothetical protein